MVLVGGMDTGWKPGGGMMSGKSSLLSEDTASDMSTTAGCRDVMCVRREYTYSPQSWVASCIHLRNFFCKTWAGGFPINNRVVSSDEKVVKGKVQ